MARKDPPRSVGKLKVYEKGGQVKKTKPKTKCK